MARIKDAFADEIEANALAEEGLQICPQCKGVGRTYLEDTCEACGGDGVVSIHG